MYSLNGLSCSDTRKGEGKLLGLFVSIGDCMNKVHLIDNMEFMRNVPDKYYELAIVDPPYGIGSVKSFGRILREIS